MKIAITGSRGYIGSALCQVLRSIDEEITEYDYVLGDDILNIGALRDKVSDADCVVHLAAIVGYPAVSADPERAYQVNVIGTRNVCDVSHRVIFASAMSNYDGVKRVDEDTPIYPKTEYAKQKLEAEHIVLREPGNIVLRFGSLYGLSPNMRMDLLVHNFVRDAYKDGELEIYQPDAVRAITNIEDVLLAIARFISIDDDKGGVFNIVSVNKTKQKIAGEVQKVCNCRLRFVPGSDAESRNYLVLTRKMKNLGFSFKPHLNRSIRGILEYVRKSAS